MKEKTNTTDETNRRERADLLINRARVCGSGETGTKNRDFSRNEFAAGETGEAAGKVERRGKRKRESKTKTPTNEGKGGRN